MAAAPASLRQKLLTLRPPTLRSAFSTGSRCLSAAKSAPRWISPDCKTFYYPNGRLWTTPENTAFLAQHGIDYDATLAKTPSMGPELRRIAQKFKAFFFFHHRHIVDPIHIRYLDPRGHPLGPTQRAKWARMVKEQPLWLISSVSGGVKRVVRLRAMQRVRNALYTALEQRGYDKYGNGKDKCLRGTLVFHLYDPVAAVTAYSHELGPPLVQMLEEATSRTTTGASPNHSEPQPKTFRPRKQTSSRRSGKWIVG